MNSFSAFPILVLLGSTAAMAETQVHGLIVRFNQAGLYQLAHNSYDRVTALDSYTEKRLSIYAGANLRFSHALGSFENSFILNFERLLPLSDAQAIADRLSEDPSVSTVELDVMLENDVTPNDPYWSLVNGNDYSWSYKDSSVSGIHAQDAWALTQGSASIYVGVIDTGKTSHPDLAGRFIGGYDLISSTSTSTDGDGRDADPTDTGDDCTNGGASASWHGSHVAGTIGAASNNGIGIVGINWNSKIVPIRTQGCGGGTFADIVDAITYAYGGAVSGVPTNPYPVKVMNMSLGSDSSCSTTIQTVIDKAVAAGTTVVASAGNSNHDTVTTPHMPSGCNNVISVVATNSLGAKASYSNFGADEIISAPGGDTSSGLRGILSTIKNSGGNYVYSEYQGTSMATPHITGIVSLMYSVDSTLTPAKIKSVLTSTADAFKTPSSGTACTTSKCGAGIANAYKAVLAVKPSVTSLTSSTTEGGGCITSAFASHSQPISSKPHSLFQIFINLFNQLLPLGFAILILKFKRFKKA